MAEGNLFYVIGPSGSGKDSLMSYARKKLATNPKVVFAHRYITRPANAGGENHVALSEDEFTARVQSNLFAMHWDSHGCRYGIGSEINMWLAKGYNVVMNGSREHLPYAQNSHPKLIPVWVEVASEVLAQRLRARGREDEAEIRERLKRAAVYRATPGGIVICNDGELQDAGEKLVQLVAPKMGAICN
ncbi:MAG: phosphonate metabolism protein/1,5-bisphosphokinase (PRPP-forming) PhnN [Methylococcaceae bacterium]|nr:phosphonate metabolism protein/1,5-bisphosphokinase (PRPP-forming) PhnN [Methylococcaceae bacterium]